MRVPTIVIRIADLAEEPGGRYLVTLHLDDGSDDAWSKTPRAAMRIGLGLSHEQLHAAQSALAGGDASFQALRWIGRRLFGLVAGGEVGIAWSELVDRYVRQSPQARPAVRTVFDVLPPELTALPWELMIRANDRQVFLEESHLCVRGSYGPHLAEELLVPARVLVLVGDPYRAELRSEDEVDAIRSALRERPGEWHVDVLWGPTDVALFQRLRELRPHVLHFIGHSGRSPFSEEPQLEFRPDPGGDGWGLESYRIVNLVDSAPRLVFLNACRTAIGAVGHQSAARGVAEAFKQLGASAVLTMQGDIPSGPAVRFTAEVYRRIAHGEPVDAAVRHGRAALLEREAAVPGEWALPCLTVAAPPETVLPIHTRATRDAAELLFRDYYNDVKTFVDRTEEHRKMWRAIAPGERRVLLLTGRKQVGKSSLVQSCMLTLFLQGRQVVYVDLARHGGRLNWLEVLRRIRDRIAACLPEQAAEPRRRFDRDLWFLRQGLSPDPSATGDHSDDGGPWAPRTEREPELRDAVFASFGSLLREVAGPQLLVLALDHLGAVLEPDVIDNLGPRLFIPIAEADYPIHVLVIETRELAYRLIVPPLRDRCAEETVEPFRRTEAVRMVREFCARNCYPFDEQWASFAEGIARAQADQWWPADLRALDIVASRWRSQ